MTAEWHALTDVPHPRSSLYSRLPRSLQVPDLNMKRRLGRHLEDMGTRLLPEFGAQLGTQVMTLTAYMIALPRCRMLLLLQTPIGPPIITPIF